MPSFHAPKVNLIISGGGQLPVVDSPKYVVEQYKDEANRPVQFEVYSQVSANPTAPPTINASKLTLMRKDILGYILITDNVVFDPSKQPQLPQMGGVPHIGR